MSTETETDTDTDLGEREAQAANTAQGQKELTQDCDLCDGDGWICTVWDQIDDCPKCNGEGKI